jgi:hypothetical protein
MEKEGGKTCDGNEFQLEMVRHRKELPNFFVRVGMLSTMKWWQRWPARVVLQWNGDNKGGVISK